VSLQACAEVDYYLHLARGQGRITFDRRSLRDVLDDPETSIEVVRGLQLIEEVRAFAGETIGLDASASNFNDYYDTGGDPIAWNVSASPPDRFEAYLWRFPVVGALPYKGYFNRRGAIAERDRLIDLGYEALASSVSAYSTLGYLSDPVLSTMLDNSEDRLAELVLHELTHATVYVEDETDYSESVASFIGKAGSLAFLSQRYGPASAQLQQARSRRANGAAFQAFLRDVTAQLDSLYESDSPRAEIMEERQHLFTASKQTYLERRGELGEGRYDGFLDWELNNARLLSYRRYHSHFDRFDAVLERQSGDLATTLQLFVHCGAAQNPWECLDSEGEGL
jgi:predicted aminopeptidase